VSAAAQPLSGAQWRSIALLTVGAAALFWGVRNLPTGTNLSHMDFRPGGNVIEFCDPANPQFLPVVAVRSPVTLALATASPARRGEPVRATLTLTTFSGKPIAPEDLLVVHTRPLHLLIVDPSLDDYQHVHPTPGRAPGSWDFTFTPRFGGVYRVFADFTPVATSRGLYAETEVSVSGAPSPVVAGTQAPSWTAQTAGLRLSLQPRRLPVVARATVDLTLSVESLDGSPVALGPVMDAYAHLVAFDTARSGFAHIHPNEIDPAWRPDPVHPRLTFKVSIPSAGRYVIWTQLSLNGQERLVPFWFDVVRPN
jgi:hypothetical protein